MSTCTVDFSSDAINWGIGLNDRIELESVSRGLNVVEVTHEAERCSTFDFRFAVPEAMIEKGLLKKGWNYRDCHRKGMVVECQGLTKHRFAMPFCCDLRFCRFCAPRAYMRLVKKHSPVIEYIKNHTIPGYRLREITLTKPEYRNFNQGTC